MSAEIYGYLCSIADSFEWSGNYVSYKESLENYYEYVLDGKSSKVTENFDVRKELLKDVMQKMENLAHNGVGKDNINLWKNIIEYGNVGELYNPEDFGKVLRYIISQDQLNTKVLIYFSNRAEMVSETSVSFQQACETIKKKVEQRNIKDIYEVKNEFKKMQQPRKAQLPHKVSNFKQVVICFCILGTIGILESVFFHSSSNSSSEQQVQTKYSISPSTTYDAEEQQEELEDMKKNLQSAYDWYSNNYEEETNGSDRN